MDTNQQVINKQVEIMQAKSLAFDRIMELETQNKALRSQASQLSNLVNGLASTLGVAPEQLTEAVEGLCKETSEQAK